LFETRQVTQTILLEPACSVGGKRVPARDADSDPALLLQSDIHCIAAVTLETA